MTIRSGFSLLRETFTEWSADQAPMLGAALAYYTLFSLAPLLLIVIAVAGLVLGPEAASGQLFDQLRSTVGDDTAAAVQDLVKNAGAKPSAGWIATLIGSAALLFGASGVFGQLQASLNQIWNVAPRPGRGWRALVKERLLSFGFILVTGFLLLVSLLLTTGIAFAAKWMGNLTTGTEWAGQWLNAGVSLGVITLLFALIFKFLPDVRIAWHDVWIGAFLTALLFTLGKSILGLYLGRSGVSSTFGAAGSLIGLMVWVYYSAQILFFGAEFTQVYANRFGSRVSPTGTSVAVASSLTAADPTAKS